MFYTTSLTGTYTRIINRTTWYDNMCFNQAAAYIAQDTGNKTYFTNIYIQKKQFYSISNNSSSIFV